MERQAMEWDVKMARQAEDRRKLGESRRLAGWPLEPKLRVHYNSGWWSTSWEGVVEAVVGDEVAVIRHRRGSPTNVMPVEGRTLVSRQQFEIWKVRVGPLPDVLRDE